MSGDEDKTVQELAVTRLYRYSANEQPPGSLDAHILRKSRRAIYVSRVFYAQAAMAAGMILLIFAGAFLVDKTVRFSRPHANNIVMGPWEPTGAQLDSTLGWPGYRDHRLPALSKYEPFSPILTSETLNDGLAGDDVPIDLRNFATQAKEGLNR